MKQLNTMLALLIAGTAATAQVKYEKGYFTDNTGKRTACLIRNVDSRNNPKKFSYKIAEHSEVLTGSISEVKEFGIDDQLSFKRFEVDIDRSGNEINSLNEDREPHFTNGQLFLKVLIDSKASLYSYAEGNFTRYFFSTDNPVPKQLVYKKYLTAQGGVAENNLYREQLWQTLRCEKISMEQIETLQYDTKSLIKVFMAYNECQGGQVVNYEKKSGKTKVRFNITAGVNFADFSYTNVMHNPETTEFDNKAVVRAGFETEFVMPFNKNKWSLFLEPNYHNYKSTSSTSDNTASIDYKVVQLPVGIRHYMFLNNHLKFFIDGLVSYNFNTGSYLTIAGKSQQLTSQFSYGFGTGFSLNDKFHIEYRFNAKLDIMDYYLYSSSVYNNAGLFLKYSLK